MGYNDQHIERICRICQSIQERECLIRPCNCSGSMEFVHATCLQSWIAISSRLCCEICTCRYRGHKICKYGILTSLLPYLKARWHRPKINFSLLTGKYQYNTFKYRLLTSILFRWLDYLLLPQTVLLMIMAFRDWSAWRKTQIVFVLDRCEKSAPRCRICFSDEIANLINPCNCAGSIGLVHAHCLERWASVSCRLICEICKCKYKGQRLPKYGILTSIMPFIKRKWNSTRILLFCQAIILFVIVNMEIGNYGFSVEDPDFPKPSSLFLLWCLITFNSLVYFISFSIANVVESWNTWRKSQFIFLLNRN
ncbi:hypothetical protein PGB90_009929 [Kerria lacca]